MPVEAETMSKFTKFYLLDSTTLTVLASHRLYLRYIWWIYDSYGHVLPFPSQRLRWPDSLDARHQHRDDGPRLQEFSGDLRSELGSLSLT